MLIVAKRKNLVTGKWLKHWRKKESFVENPIDGATSLLGQFLNRTF